MTEDSAQRRGRSDRNIRRKGARVGSDLPWPSNRLLRISAVGKSDAPTIEDLLNRRTFTSAIASLIVNSHTQVPLTIGVYGPWGSGKSSFLAQIAQRLGRRASVVTFNPWRLTNAGEVWTTLLAEVAPIVDKNLDLVERFRFIFSKDSTREISKLSTRTFVASKKISNWILALIASSGVLAALTRVHFPSYLLDGIVLKPNSAEAYARPILAVVSLLVVAVACFYKIVRTLAFPFSTQVQANINRFQKPGELKSTTFKDVEALRKVIDNYAAKPRRRPKPRLVLMIDDLDRCSPVRIAGVLEALNTFVAELPIITVLAIDTQYVSNAVAARYRFLFESSDNSAERELYGRQFLEKIVHIPFRLPAVGNYEDYVERLLTIVEEEYRIAPQREAETRLQLPSLKQLFHGRTLFEKIELLFFLLGFLPVLHGLFRGYDTDQRWQLNIDISLLFGIELTRDQELWLSQQDHPTQVYFQELRDNARDRPLVHDSIQRRLSVANAHLLRKQASLQIQDSDRHALRKHIGILRGNPRSIKRFVNTYLLAKSITAISARLGDENLEGLAAWLVLLQNWPSEGGKLCANFRTGARSICQFIQDGREFSSVHFIEFVKTYSDVLEQWASIKGHIDIAHCFSFYTAEPLTQ